MLAAPVETTSLVPTVTLTVVPLLMSAAWIVSVPAEDAPPVPVVPPKPVVAPTNVSVSLRLTLITVEPTAPPEKPMDFSEAVPIVVLSTVYDVLCQEASWRAWVTVASIDWMVVVIEVKPLLAALMVLTPLVMESRRFVNSDARAESAAAVKKFVGLSRAVLTFLPVARRCCVWLCSCVVFCRARRLARTPAERVTEEAMILTFLVVCRTGVYSTDHIDRRRSHGSTAH